MKNIITRCLMLVILVFAVGAAQAAEPSKASTTNARQARQMFNEVYNKVFGPQGCTLSYAVNIIGIYKTQGTITMKQKKVHFTEKRYLGWSDGHTLYRVDLKKKEVDIFDPNKENKDNMASKYTYDINKFSYSWENSKEGIVINIDAPSGSGGIRHAKAILDPHSHNPIAVKIKVAFFWTTIKLSGFHSGGINDKVFIFPRQAYKSYKFVDKRKED